MFKNLKIQKKLFTAFGIILVAFVISGAIFFASLATIQSNFQDFNENAFQLSNAAAEMRADVNELSDDVCNAIMTPDVAQAEKYIQMGKDRITDLTNALEYLRGSALSDELSDEMTRLQELINQFNSVSEELFKLCINLRNDVATGMYFKSFEPLLVESQEIVTSISTQAEQYAAEIYDSTMSTVGGVKAVLIVVCIFTFILTVWIALSVTKTLVVPIDQLEQVAKALSEGKLKGSSALVPYESKDELGQLAADMRFSMDTLDSYVAEISDILHQLATGDLTIPFKDITDYLGDFSSIKTSMATILKSFNNTITDIYNASLQVDVGSEQVSSGAQALSQGATEQASAVEQLSATVAEVSDHVNMNAENAVNASKMSNEAGAGVVESNQYMQQLMGAMGEIDRTTGEIEKIIKTIEDIAFQTNILALNAAVEAARAGAAGKGFAVVADEVRSLAAKSAEAAKNTNDLIGSTVGAVKNGMNVASQTDHALRMVVEKASTVDAKITEIAKVSEEQAEKIAQISDGIEQIASVIHNNSATAEQSAAASEELAGQATVMKELIGKFKLFANSEAAAAAAREARSSFGASYDHATYEAFANSGDKY